MDCPPMAVPTDAITPNTAAVLYCQRATIRAFDDNGDSESGAEDGITRAQKAEDEENHWSRLLILVVGVGWRRE